jgi:hypothetical protein
MTASPGGDPYFPNYPVRDAPTWQFVVVLGVLTGSRAVKRFIPPGP